MCSKPHDGWRYQCLATDTRGGQLAFLEARHRAHARVEDQVRPLKQTGLGRFPSREFAINAVWLQLALTAADLIAWTQTILLDGGLANAEPNQLRYRLLHTAARIIHGECRTRSRSRPAGPGPPNLAAAFTRLAQIRQPLTRLTASRPAAHPPPKDPGEPDTRPAHPHCFPRRRSTTSSRPNTTPPRSSTGLPKEGG